MKSIIQRYTQISVAPEGDPIFSEMATHISIEDEACGEYVRVVQYGDKAEKGEININPEEWPAIRDAINTMVVSCRKEDA